MDDAAVRPGQIKPVVDYDHFSPAYATGWAEQIGDLHARCPVAWSEAYGGFWVLADYEAVAQAARDYETFSSFNAMQGPSGPQGILIPPNPFKMALNETDPPASTKLRMLEAPYFTPKNVNQAAELAKGFARETIAAAKVRGGGDMVHDIAMPVPARTTLKLVGVPDEEWKDFALPAHQTAHLPTSSPDFPHAAIAYLLQRLNALVEDRRASPKGDIASTLANATVEDQPLGQDVAVGMLLALVTGGFDTTTSLTCHALLWLDDHREAWPRLLEEPKAMDNALEEFLRAFPPTHGTARNVVKDVEVCGRTLKAGERVLLSWAAANHDPRKFEHPHEVRLDRANAREHQAFGGGLHRCLGAPLAKVEAKMMLEMVMREMPGFRIERDKVRRYETAGLVNGYLAMPFEIEG